VGHFEFLIIEDRISIEGKKSKISNTLIYQVVQKVLTFYLHCNVVFYFKEQLELSTMKMTIDKTHFRHCMTGEFNLKKKQSKRLNRFARLIGTVFLMSELVKIGLLDSGQETLTSTTKTGPGGLLRLILEEEP
jgi:hypothetical protein